MTGKSGTICAKNTYRVMGGRKVGGAVIWPIFIVYWDRDGMLFEHTLSMN